MICVRPTERYPQGRTGTTAGYQAHRKQGEPTCADCRKAHAAEVRTRQQRPDYKSRRRAEYERNWDSYSARNLKAKHGLTVDQYAEKLKGQDDGCAICGTRLPGGRSKGRFFVDHDHDCCPSYMSCSKCRRGLLCAACNVGLGAFGDDTDRLIAAAAYLMSWRESDLPPTDAP